MGEHFAPLVVTDLGSGRRRCGEGQVRDEHVDRSGRADELLGGAGLGQRLLTSGNSGAVLPKNLDEGGPMKSRAWVTSTRLPLRLSPSRATS
jgi:hypothetical protein